MDQINYMAFGTLLLLSIVVFTIGKKEEISCKKRSAVSCGPAQSASAHNPWPGNDNSGNGCTHQSVSAVFLGRHKRDRPHGC